MKIHKIVLIFFVCNLMMPTYSMFMRVRQKLQPGARSVSGNVPPAAKTKPILQKGMSPVRLKAVFSSKKDTMAAVREQVARFLKAQYTRFSSLWKKEPTFVAEQELSVPVAQKTPIASIGQAESLSVGKGNTTEESVAIIQKLKEENPSEFLVQAEKIIKIEIDRLVQTVKGRDLLYVVASSNDTQLKAFVIDYIKRNPMVMRTLLETKNGQKLIQKLIEVDFSLKDAFHSYLTTEKDFNFIKPSSDLMYILDGPDFIKALFGFDSSYSQVPSYRHLVKYYQYFGEKFVTGEKLIKVCDRMIQDDMRPIWNHMIQNAMQNEKKLVESGYDVYYHGTGWEYNFLSDLYMMLYSYKSGKKLKNFRFLHFDDPILGKVSQRFFESAEATGQQLVSKGTMATYHSKLGHDLGIGTNILFLSKYLFGNMRTPGSSPISFMLDNFNFGEEGLSEQGEKLLTIKEIFSMFGYSDVYKKYAQELLSMQKKHKKLSPYGEIIQIAIPKKDLDKCVYYARLGQHGQKEEFKLPDGSTTENINVISDHVNKNPEEGLEFILNMTRSTFGGHNPEFGIQMFSYNLADPNKMAKFEEEDEKPVLDKVRESLKQKGIKDIKEYNAAMARE